MAAAQQHHRGAGHFGVEYAISAHCCTIVKTSSVGISISSCRHRIGRAISAPAGTTLRG
jgi:hypothetical protein